MIPEEDRTEEGRAPGLDDAQDGEKFLSDFYQRMIERSAPRFGFVMTRLSETSALPAVFHCAAGKDRTGMVAAVLLGILGVDEADILDDYELTSVYRRSEALAEAVGRMRARSEMAPAVIAGVMRTPRWALQAALHRIAEEHGGFEGFVVGPGSAEASVPERLRELHLEPA